MLKIIHSLCLLSRLSISRCRITIVPRRKYAPYDRCPSLNHRRRKYPRPRRYDSTLFIFEKNDLSNSSSYAIPFSKTFLPSLTFETRTPERKKENYHESFIIPFLPFLQKKHDIVLTALVFQST